MVEEEAIDVMIGFRDEKINLASVTYVELAQCGITCACQKEHPLADRKQLTLKDLNEEPIVLCEPDRCAEAIAQLQGHLLCFSFSLSFPDLFWRKFRMYFDSYKSRNRTCPAAKSSIHAPGRADLCSS